MQLLLFLLVFNSTLSLGN